MGKEEKKADLEQLLNTLIKKGWKPYGWKNIKKATNEGWFCSFIRDSKKGFGGMSEISHRELASKESGLWQFVCENGMVYYNDESIYSPTEFRIVESALTDEDKLEDFILDNIKVGNED